MRSPHELNALVLAADKDPHKIGEALHGMLDANVYLLIRLDSTPEEVNVFQFRHPKTGKLMVPFYSDRQTAVEKSRGKLNVLTYPGRKFFEMTFGSILMLDPGERNFLLFPVEIAAILAGVYTSGPLPTRAVRRHH